MITKPKFVDWLRQSGNPDNIILAALLEQDIIEMPASKAEKRRGESI